MPLVRISLVKGKPPALRRSIGDAVHRALVETIDVPPLDRFQLLTEHEPGDLVYEHPAEEEPSAKPTPVMPTFAPLPAMPAPKGPAPGAKPKGKTKPKAKPKAKPGAPHSQH